MPFDDERGSGPPRLPQAPLLPHVVCAEELRIAGLVPLSSVDWPGKLVATVFLQGCPWRCFYCHNTTLIPMRRRGLVDWLEVEELLARRHGLLDGFVFTGGEALTQAGLPDAARLVRRAGFAVGLHTAGAYPRRLAALLREGLVDWVGLDIKALPEHYGQVVGREAAGVKAWETLALLLESGADYEVRTTVVDGDVTEVDALAVARRLREQGVRSYALQQARPLGAMGAVPERSEDWDARCAALAAEIEAIGWKQFTYRPAV